MRGHAYLNKVWSDDCPSFDEVNERSSGLDCLQHDVTDTVKQQSILVTSSEKVINNSIVI